MNYALGSYYSTNGMALAITIHRFPEDYKDYPNIKIRALRYIYSHHSKYNSRNKPEIEELNTRTSVLFRECLLNNNAEGMREVADIALEFMGGEERENLLNIIREMDEKKEDLFHLGEALDTRVKIVKSVYNDTQNVHNAQINKTVLRSLDNLCLKYEHLYNIKNERSDNPDETFRHKVNILENIREILVKKYPAKTDLIISSIDYIRNSTAIFGIRELGIIDGFIALWFWICEHEHKDELETRLLEELKEMNGQCTTGHIARLMNVMQGFTDDEKLCIRISNKEQCNAVVKQHLKMELQSCQDEDVIDEMTSGGEKYIKFIRQSVMKKLLEWKREYGEEMLEYIAETVNDFTKTVVFSITPPENAK